MAIVPMFANGGALNPVTPNNGNPNTIYNQPRNPTVAPTAGPSPVDLAGYNQLNRSPYSLTLQQPQLQAPMLARNTMFSDSVNRLGLTSLGTSLQSIPIPGQNPAPASPGTWGITPQPGAPVAPVLPGQLPGGAIPAPGMGPAGPEAGFGGAVTPDWASGETGVAHGHPNYTQLRDQQEFLNQLGASNFDRNRSLTPQESSSLGGFAGTMGQLWDRVQASAADAFRLPDSERGWLRLAANVLIPGGGQLVDRLLQPRPVIPNIPLQGIERDTEGAQRTIDTNLQEYNRELMAAGLAGNASREDDIAAARARLQAHYDGREQMTPAQVRSMNNIIAMAQTFGQGNTAVGLAGSSPRFNMGAGAGSNTGNYMAPSAAVQLSNFTTASTRSGNRSPQDVFNEAMAMIRRSGGTQQQ